MHKSHDEYYEQLGAQALLKTTLCQALYKMSG